MKFEIIRKLETELEKLNHELRVDIPKELKRAADYGDLSENAEYDAAKQRKSFVESRIGQLQKRISEILAINLNSIPLDRVGLGSIVKLSEVSTGDEVTYTFVFPEEVDPENGRISLASPVGKALVGRKDGDEVVVSTPKGQKTFEIIELVTIHDKTN
jgi:transcription elongation factor GreA